MTHVSANVVQSDFRFREDSGNEATPTWLALANTNVSIDVDTDFRYRTVVAETAGGSASNEQFALYYSLNGGGYALVTASTPVQFGTPTGETDGTATTQQVGSGSFVAGEFDSNGTTNTVTLTSQETEFEWCLALDSGQVSNADTVDLRTYGNGAALNAYTNTGRVTAVAVVTHDASGTPQAGIASTVGSAKVFHDASGTPQADIASTVGAAKRTADASGTPQADIASTVGSATVQGAAVTASGTPQAGAASTTGSAKRIHDASGTPQAGIATTVGIAKRVYEASGTPQADIASTVGAATRTLNASGTPSSNVAITTGATTRTVKSSGTPQAGAATTDGTAIIPGVAITASGDLAANAAATTSNAIKTAKSVGTPQADVATTVGTATRVCPSSGTLAALNGSVSALATRIPQSSGTVSAGTGSTVGVSSKVVKVSDGVQANPATTTGTGTKAISSSGILEAEPVTVDGSAQAGEPPVINILAADQLNDLWSEYLDTQGVIASSLNDKILEAFRQENETSTGNIQDNVNLYLDNLGFVGSIQDKLLEFLRIYYPEYDGSLTGRLRQTLKSGRFFL